MDVSKLNENKLSAETPYQLGRVYFNRLDQKYAYHNRESQVNETVIFARSPDNKLIPIKCLDYINKGAIGNLKSKTITTRTDWCIEYKKYTNDAGSGHKSYDCGATIPFPTDTNNWVYSDKAAWNNKYYFNITTTNFKKLFTKQA
jgi:hypothetical protein